MSIKNFFACFAPVAPVADFAPNLRIILKLVQKSANFQNPTKNFLKNRPAISIAEPKKAEKSLRVIQARRSFPAVKLHKNVFPEGTKQAGNVLQTGERKTRRSKTLLKLTDKHRKPASKALPNRFKKLRNAKMRPPVFPLFRFRRALKFATF